MWRRSDGQQDDAPEALDGVVVAARAAGGAQAVEEVLVGQDLEELREGGGGAVFEAEPRRRGVGGEKAHVGVDLLGATGIVRTRAGVTPFKHSRG